MVEDWQEEELDVTIRFAVRLFVSVSVILLFLLFLQQDVGFCTDGPNRLSGAPASRLFWTLLLSSSENWSRTIQTHFEIGL